jgi:hypothetical protein
MRSHRRPFARCTALHILLVIESGRETVTSYLRLSVLALYMRSHRRPFARCTVLHILLVIKSEGETVTPYLRLNVLALRSSWHQLLVAWILWQ